MQFKSHIARVLLLLFSLLTVGEAIAKTPHIIVMHETESLASRITIQSAEGRIRWSDILTGLARAKGLNERSLDGIFPNRQMRITGLAGRLQIMAINAAFNPGMQFDVQPPEAVRHPHLVIKLDRAATLSSQRRMKAWLQQKSLALFSKSASPREKKFGLRLDNGWNKRSSERPVVVLIHGMNTNSAVAAPLLAGPRREGFSCGRFDYPNDQAIADSATLLSAQLKAFGRKHPNRKIALVTHSMGGLVARAVIEDGKLDPGNVTKLIMIAPPSQGSLLAHFAFGLDVWEYAIGPASRNETRKFYASIEDGFAQAYTDLQPGSVFLRQLNSRERNPNVRYTIVLGTNSPLSLKSMESMSGAVRKSGEKSRWLRFFGPRLQPMLADLEEVVDGKGDGAVAVKRGKLDGVSDVVVLDFRHDEVLLSNPQGDVKQVHDEILLRLSND